MLGMGVFKQLIKELYEWLLHSVDVATQHLVAMVLKNPLLLARGGFCVFDIP